MSDSLLNRSACRDLALRWGARRTGWQPTRVSKKYLDDIEAKVRLLIQRSVDSHRSVGKTIIDFL